MATKVYEPPKFGWFYAPLVTPLNATHVLVEADIPTPSIPTVAPVQRVAAPTSSQQAKQEDVYLEGTCTDLKIEGLVPGYGWKEGESVNNTGNDRFYEKYVPVADDLYDQQLEELRKEGFSE